MDKHNEESGCYNKIHYSDIPCAKCGEKKIPLGQESACEMNGKYYCPECFHDIDADEIREEMDRL